MSARFRLDAPHDAPARRRTVGLLVSSACREVSAAVVQSDRAATDAPPGILAVRSARIPDETTSLFAQLSGGGTSPLGLLPMLRAQLTEIEASLVADLLREFSPADSPILAAGVHDPGLWNLPPNAPSGAYLGLCEAARLAEDTGLNVIDAFPARDLAQGGQGGPITAMAEWILLKDAQSTRALLNLGQTVRMTYLPSARTSDAQSRILSFEVGPGTRLLDLLAQRLTGGQQRFDPGGRLAVQGRRIPELVEHWLRDPYFERPLPRWHPRGVRPERFLTESVQMAVDSGWSVRDLLCTATHFVAEAVALAVRKRLPDDPPADQIVVTGGGQQNGMLLREITVRLPRIPIIRIGDLGIPGEALGPASVAVLAMLHLDQTPANPTAVTGAEVPRVLGRLTPGSPQSWQQLLHTLAGTRPVVRPLRSAL